MRRSLLALVCLIPLSLLSACAGAAGLGDLLGRADVAKRGTVNAAAAAALISQYRAGRGLKPLVIDERLTKIAADHAYRMASMDRMSHVLPGEGSFQQRLAAGGFQASMAAENVAAGQDSLAEVFEAWRKSSGHNANMLLPNVSRMGIAVANTDAGRYHTYWALVVGEPYVPRRGAGPGAMFGPSARQ